MSDVMLLSQLKSLEMQLTILKKQVEQSGEFKPGRFFGDLYAIAGPKDVSSAEIDDALYGLDEDVFTLDEAALS